MASADTAVTTGKVRLSYVHVFEPFAFDGQDEAKYSVMLLIPKSDKETLGALRAAEKAAAEAGKAKFGGKIPANLGSIIRDGDDFADDYPERAGHMFMTVSTTRKPQVVDQNVDLITEPTELYSGCYARVSLNGYAYSVSGNKGVSFGLKNVQKVADGEPLGGFSRAVDDFEALEDADLL